MADEGNLIKANADTAMVVINQVQPIYVSSQSLNNISGR